MLAYNGPLVEAGSVGGAAQPFTCLGALAMKLSRWARRHGTAFARDCAARRFVLRGLGLTGSVILLTVENT
jgi:hypothetical protein